LQDQHLPIALGHVKGAGKLQLELATLEFERFEGDSKLNVEASQSSYA
jgi:hypothetical protein